MKTIEKYIQLAIDNGYDFKCKVEIWEDWFKYYSNCTSREVWVTIGIIKLITSKPFISAIARGINRKSNKAIYDTNLYRITIEQAIHIRDNKLEEFINNLLWDD